MIINYCIVCNKRLSNRRGKFRPKYCRSHYTLAPNFIIGAAKNQFKVGHTPYNKGKEHLREEKNPSWKGNAVGYFALHHWVTRYKGKPKLCDICGQDDPDKRYEWANKSGTYKRDLSDWIRMCKKCHNDYDGVNAWQNKIRAFSGLITVAEKVNSGK